MGLKTTNYEIKKLGITIPTAYAIIRNIEIHGSVGKAEFVIQATRDLASTKQPLDKFYLDFPVNRNENPYITAYNKAKGTTEKVKKDKKTKNLIYEYIPNILYGWEDDIL